MRPTLHPLSMRKKQIENVEAKTATLIDRSPEHQVKNDILQSMPGVGKVHTAILCSLTSSSIANDGQAQKKTASPNEASSLTSAQ